MIPVLYEDEACIVFNKPPGLLVIPTDKNEDRTLVRMVNDEHRQGPQLYPAHRLDRDTSGVILFVKSKELQQKIMESFKAKQVHKAYVAFVHGRIQPQEGKIRIPIKDYFQRKFQRQMPAQSALTLYRVRDYYTNFSVLDVTPVTGRTNQIRIHMAKVGHPIVGEDKYAFRKDFELRFRRTALHAAKLEWPHPVTGKMIRAEAQLPDDMDKFLQTH